MRKSTLLTRLLGGGALAGVAAALLLAAAWAAACRLAPPLRPATATPAAAPGHVPPHIPAKLRPPAKDYGLALGALLTVLGPVTALRCVATNDGSSGIGLLGGLVMLLLLLLTLGLLAYVAFGAAVWQRHSSRGDKPGAIAVTNHRWLEVRRAGLRQRPHHLGRGGPRLEHAPPPDRPPPHHPRPHHPAAPPPAKFRPRLHLPQLARLLAAYVLLLPALLGLLGSVPALSWLLCAAAAAAIAASGLNVTKKVEQLSDDLDWRIDEFLDPSIA
ncbi:hypothetical protein OG607_20350 [Streptomyces sp. NBC_01537]|uniref:hypothetical protein n=1 Tax=Streptomyces sp. NBC_01537 TaxID=2903896 RepID=UPI00386CE232